MTEVTRLTNKVDISIICPTYNHEPYIRQAIDSILSQKTSYLFEVLIGEDCSPDNSRQILDEYATKYPDKIKVFNRNPNMGASRNGYDLYMRSRGKYIAVLELDDYWIDEYKLQKQVKYLETHSEIIGCAHDSIVINENGSVMDESLTHGRNGFVGINDFMENESIYQTSSLVYRNIFHDGNDYSILYKSSNMVGDVTINSILLMRSNIYVMKDKMSVYRRVIKHNGSSVTSLLNLNEALSAQNTMNQLLALNDYFNGQIDYSKRMCFPMKRYIVGILRFEKQFKIGDYLKIRKAATKEARKEVRNYVLRYPFKKIKMIIGKTDNAKK